jgi:hypothetical protein
MRNAAFGCQIKTLIKTYSFLEAILGRTVIRKVMGGGGGEGSSFKKEKQKENL